MKPSKALILGFGCLFFGLASIKAEEAATSRIWTDIQGRQLEATFVGLEGGNISLKMATGVVTFPLAKLSAEDQAFAKKATPSDTPTYIPVNATIGQAAGKIDELVVAGLLKARDIIAKNNAAATQATDKRELPKPNPLMSDEQFVRRLYLDVVGRIPNYDEAKTFIADASPTKRAKLIETLLNDKGYASNTYNYFAEMLRVKDRLEQDNLRGVPYINWLQKQVEANTPWDKMVYAMITAEGKMWDKENGGAAGYLLRDAGMPLDNLANTLSVFLGTDVACAQCHDHPFADWTQKQFYEMAAFFGSTSTTMVGGMASNYNKRLMPEIEKMVTEGGGDIKRERNGFQNYMGANRYSVTELGKNKMVLPHDYKYKDAKPGDPVAPKFITWSKDDLKSAAYKDVPMAAAKKGKAAEKAAEKSDNSQAREKFAKWVTHPENPRFAMSIANRMWKRAFGVGIADPVTSIDDPEKSSNPALLKHLAAEMKRVNFDLKKFMQIVYNTQTYQREATVEEVPMGEPYYFQGPLLRRMTAEQAWDSYMTLVLGEPDKYAKPLEDLYSRSIDLDLTNPKLDAKTVVMKYAAYRNMAAKERALVGGGLDEAGDDSMMSAKTKKAVKVEKKAGDDMTMDGGPKSLSYNGMILRRAAEIEQPAPGGHFLAEFGQSQRLVIDGGSKVGSVPQVLMMMNGKAQEMLTSKESLIFRTMGKVQSPSDKVEAVFLSVLSRKPTLSEKDIAKRGLEAGGADGFPNLIWALINTREFMFVQ
ncbi:MAG: hypothetical protein JWO94_2732 [Verrucomicrobiaceae bacterium]|nr:hypothetical protein [Verrucomicrobiaceae bacterium]